MVGLGKTLVKEKRLFYEIQNLHKILYTTAQLPETWYWRNPLPQGNTLNSVTYGAGQFYAVGDVGTIISSPDGVVWTGQSPPIIVNLLGIVHHDGNFVAVGGGGVILFSTDGSSWAVQQTDTTDTIRAVCYGDGLFVAVGDNGLVLISPDGRAWNKKSSGITGKLYGVAYGANTFIAVSYDGTIIGSANGEEWDTRSTEVVGHNTLLSITFGNNMFVAAGSYCENYHSTDGITWTKNNFLGYDFCEVAFSGDQFILLGKNYSSSPIIHTSTDAVGWSTKGIGASFVSLNSVTYGNNFYFYVCC
jgi:hypothetical protein